MQDMGRVSRALKWAEVKARPDIYTWRGTTEWGNHDLYPVVPEEKKFGYLAYFGFWTNAGTSITSFTLGSSYIAVGLNASQTIVACFLGGCISAGIGYFGARPGQDYGVGWVRLLVIRFP
jgi:NCS1 family nucleobase:cation symporter-1